MAEQLTISEILTVAKVSQYLASQDIANGIAFKGGNIENNIPRIIYMERIGIQKRFDLNPNDPTLRDTANYLFALLGKYARLGLIRLSQLLATPPVVTGPSNASVNVGANAAFTIVVTSSLPYVISWFKNGILMAGETGLTYTLNSAQLSDSGSTFSAVAASASGTGNSSVATLTVSENITGEYYYGDINYYTELAAGTDNVPYVGSFNITNQQPFTVPFPLAASNNRCQVVKYPNTQPVVDYFYNTAGNQGPIEGVEYEEILTIGSNLYIVSRGAISLDGTNTNVIFSNV